MIIYPFAQPILGLSKEENSNIQYLYIVICEMILLKDPIVISEKFTYTLKQFGNSTWNSIYRSKRLQLLPEIDW